LSLAGVVVLCCVVCARRVSKFDQNLLM